MKKKSVLAVLGLLVLGCGRAPDGDVAEPVAATPAALTVVQHFRKTPTIWKASGAHFDVVYDFTLLSDMSITVTGSVEIATPTTDTETFTPGKDGPPSTFYQSAPLIFNGPVEQWTVWYDRGPAQTLHVCRQKLGSLVNGVWVVPNDGDHWIVPG